MNEVMMNNKGENDNDLKNVPRSRGQKTDRSKCKQTKVEMIGKRGMFLV